MYIYSDIDITDRVTVLAKEECKVLELNKKEETLENYYINLMGGDR